MDPVLIVLIVIGILVIGGLISMFVVTLPISKKVYFSRLVRTEPEKWGRVCSAPENEEQLAMWNKGIKWAEPFKDNKIEVHIENDGFNLYGEFFDFGSDRCVLILPGRCESLVYSYYFAEPYYKAGLNVLVVDTRCHGKSDGVYNTIGVKESDDVIAWINYVAEKFNQKEFYIHGICIGTSAGLFAMAKSNCPTCLKGLITEGCFVSFRETFKRHMMAEKRPLFPVLDTVMLLINKHTGTNVYKDKPISVIKKIKPEHRLLFLYGEKDIFSIPKKSIQLFNAACSKDKKLVWFKEGGHSHLRINNTKKYDETIVEFLKNE